MRCSSAARSRLTSAAGPGSRHAWFSPCTPYSGTPWSPQAKLVKVPVLNGLTVLQARAVLKTPVVHSLRPTSYVLALCLGLWRGELFGLRWVDVDPDDKRNALRRLGDGFQS